MEAVYALKLNVKCYTKGNWGEMRVGRKSAM